MLISTLSTNSFIQNTYWASNTWKALFLAREISASKAVSVSALMEVSCQWGDRKQTG